MVSEFHLRLRKGTPVIYEKDFINLCGRTAMYFANCSVGDVTKDPKRFIEAFQETAEIGTSPDSIKAAQLLEEWTKLARSPGAPDITTAEWVRLLFVSRNL